MPLCPCSNAPQPHPPWPFMTSSPLPPSGKRQAPLTNQARSAPVVKGRALGQVVQSWICGLDLR
jgi:hypothetical protein